jgi:two-component system, OmpR family, response regulator ResD
MTHDLVNQPSSPPRRVLVVDDEAHICEVVARYLVAAGFIVTEAADSPSALRAGATQPLDIIVLDLMLPGMGGREVTQMIRASSAIPIIMLTPLGDEEERLEGSAFGADDYVTKPFSPREIVVRVAAVLRRIEAAMVPAMTGSSIAPG